MVFLLIGVVKIDIVQEQINQRQLLIKQQGPIIHKDGRSSLAQRLKNKASTFKFDGYTKNHPLSSLLPILEYLQQAWDELYHNLAPTHIPISITRLHGR